MRAMRVPSVSWWYYAGLCWVIEGKSGDVPIFVPFKSLGLAVTNDVFNGATTNEFFSTENSRKVGVLEVKMWTLGKCWKSCIV